MWAAGVILYILLCGFPPFRSLERDQDELFDIIQLGHFEFLAPYWDNISEGEIWGLTLGKRGCRAGAPLGSDCEQVPGQACEASAEPPTAPAQRWAVHAFRFILYFLLHHSVVLDLPNATTL